MSLLGITLLGIAVVDLLARQAQTQRYSPGPLPAIGDIQSECVEEYPAPRTRTDVGIGEDVTCWIDTSTWQDTDVTVHPILIHPFTISTTKAGEKSAEITATYEGDNSII